MKLDDQPFYTDSRHGQSITEPPKKENLRQRAYLNSATSVLDYGSSVITGFIVIPFLVSGLGSSLFGAWKILSQLTAYANITDVRVTQVLKWAIARDREVLDEGQIREYVTAAFVIVLLVLPVFLAAGAALIWYSPSITGVGSEYETLIRITASLLVLALVVHNLFELFESILRGMNLTYKRMGLRALVFFLGGMAQILVVAGGYGLVALATVQIVVNLVIGVILYLLVKKHVPWFGFGVFRRSRFYSFFRTSGWFMGWSGVKLVLVNSDKVLLGFLAGPVLVTQYVITEYLIKAASSLVNNMVHGVMPGIGKLYGTGDHQKLYHARNVVMQLTWLMAAAIGSVVILNNGLFIGLWTGADHYAGDVAGALIVVVAMQYLFIQNDSMIIDTTLNIRSKLFLGMASALLTIVVILLLVPGYGIAGLCAGLLVGRSVMMVGYPMIISEKLGLSKTIWTAISPKKIVMLFLLWGAAYYLNGIILVDGWLALVASVIISGLVFFLMAFYGGLSRHERQGLLDHAFRISPFKSGD